METHNHNLIYLFHIFFVGSILIYVGIKQNNIYKPFYNFLLFLGALIIIFHSYKVYTNIQLHKNYIINILHIVLFAPVLLYIGYNQENTPRIYYEFLLMIGFAAIGYHLYYLLLTNIFNPFTS